MSALSILMTPALHAVAQFRHPAQGDDGVFPVIEPDLVAGVVGTLLDTGNGVGVSVVKTEALHVPQAHQPLPNHRKLAGEAGGRADKPVEFHPQAVLAAEDGRLAGYGVISESPEHSPSCRGRHPDADALLIF